MLTNEVLNLNTLSLMQMVAYNSNDYKYEKPIDREINEIREYYVKNDICNLSRVCDVMKCHSIIFTMDQNMTIEEFTNITIDTMIHLVSINHVLFSYNINFLSQFNPVIKYENKFIIKIPEFLNKKIYVLLNKENYFQFQFTNSIGNISIFMECIYLYGDKRKILMDKSRNDIYSEVEYTYQKCDTMTYDVIDDEVDLCLDFKNHCTKGYFIECDVNNLLNLTYKMNSHKHTSYDKFQIYMFCTKISDNLLYMPFDVNMKYDDTNLSSYHGSMNNQRVDDSNIVLKFNNISNRVIKIHSLAFKTYVVEDYKIKFNMPFYGGRMCIYGIRARNQDQIEYIFITINKKLDNDEVCHITQDIIDNDDIYSECVHCKNTFSYDNIKMWLNINKTCPLCRSTWSESIKYKNC
jgi:hypothetical protein